MNGVERKVQERLAERADSNGTPPAGTDASIGGVRSMGALRDVLADRSQIRDLPPGQVGPLMIELVHLLVHLAARLPDPGAPERRPEAVVRQDRLLTPDEAAGLLGVSRRWLYRHARDLPFARRLSRKALRFSEAGLNKYLTDRSRRHGSI